MSLTQQLTFEQTRIARIESKIKCDKQIFDNGEVRSCGNYAILKVIGDSDLKFYCHIHAKDTWKEALEAKRLFGGK